MKKIIQSLGILLSLCLMIYPMSKIDLSDAITNANSIYILSSNESHLHDQLEIKLNENSYVMCGILYDNYSLPFKDKNHILSFKENPSSIDSIYPLYPLRTWPITKGEKVPVIIHNNNTEKEITFPHYKLGLGGLKRNYVFGLEYQPYLNEENFLKNHHVIKKYACNSGIYLNENVYRSLSLWMTKDTLSFTCPVAIPVAAKIVDDSYYGVGECLYEITQYAYVDYTFEIEGVFISEDSTSSICIPYALSEQIYNSIDPTDYHLNDDEIYYEPNTWVIECNKVVEMDDIGNELLNLLDNFVLAEYYQDSNRKVYVGEVHE